MPPNAEMANRKRDVDLHIGKSPPPPLPNPIPLRDIKTPLLMGH